MKNFRQMTPPINVGDEVDLKIEAVGEKGDGIAKVKGFVIFVPKTKEGQTVKVKITRVLSKVGFGEVIGEASASEDSNEDEESQDAPEAKEESYEDTENFGEDDESEEESSDEE